jgi:hypothetical protein
MKANKLEEGFDEHQSLLVIQEMIKVSQKKLKSDGILFILWGWILTIHYVIFYLVEKLTPSFQLNRILKYAAIALVLGGFAYTLYYLVKERRKVQTYIGVSLRYIWISLFFCMVLINLIQNNVIHEIIFELQHPIFMVIIAFATVVTGGILRYKLIVIGGIIFGLLAFASSYLRLPDQLIMEAIAWFIAFVIPGHILYAKRND